MRFGSIAFYWGRDLGSRIGVHIYLCPMLDRKLGSSIGVEFGVIILVQIILKYLRDNIFFLTNHTPENKIRKPLILEENIFLKDIPKHTF